MSEVLFPVGRMIGGSVYKAYPETDSFGKPKLNHDGTPKTSFSFGVAIPKAGEQHWSQTPWGAKVYAVGQSGHPNQIASPNYAWKIKDGDSTVPNRNGKLPSSQEGCAGCWIIWFKQSWAPKLVTDKGNVQLIEPEAIVPGYYVEVFANVITNTGPTPGVYMNPLAVNRVAFGEKFVTASVDASSVGFGQSALPAGASATPIGGGFQPQGLQPFQNNAMGAAAGTFNPNATQPAQVLAPPNPAFLAIPPVPQKPAHVMLPAAQGATYEQLIGAGWNDALLVQHGMMQS